MAGGGRGACKEGGETILVFLSKGSHTRPCHVLLEGVCPMVEQVLSGLLCGSVTRGGQREGAVRATPTQTNQNQLDPLRAFPTGPCGQAGYDSVPVLRKDLRLWLWEAKRNSAPYSLETGI